jgi:hypothetical protein
LIFYTEEEEKRLVSAAVNPFPVYTPEGRCAWWWWVLLSMNDMLLRLKMATAVLWSTATL